MEVVQELLPSSSSSRDHVDGGTLEQWLALLKEAGEASRSQLWSSLRHHGRGSVFPTYKFNEQLCKRTHEQIEDTMAQSQLVVEHANKASKQLEGDMAAHATNDKHLGFNRTMLDLCAMLLDFSKQLDVVEHAVCQGKIHVAATRLQAIQRPEFHDDPPNLYAYHALEQRAQSLHTHISTMITDGIAQCIHQDNGLQLHVYTICELNVAPVAITSRADVAAAADDDDDDDDDDNDPSRRRRPSMACHVPLAELLQASKAFDMQHSQIAAIQHQAKSFFHQLMQPFVPGTRRRLVMDHDHGTLSIDVAHENMDDEEQEVGSISGKQEAAVHHALLVLKDVDASLAFFFNRVFAPSNNGSNESGESGEIDESSELKHLCAHMLLPDLLHHMIDDVLSPAIPSAAADPALFASLAQMAAFSKHIEHQWLVQYTGTSNTLDVSMARYAGQVDEHMATRRKAKVLSKARQVLLRKIYDAEPDEHGRKLTQTPRVIWAMLQDLLDEAARLQQQQQQQEQAQKQDEFGENRYPCTIAALHASAEAILAMYMAIMPSIHRPQLIQAQHAVVFYNDCLWLADRPLQLPNSHAIAQQLRDLAKFWHNMVLFRPLNSISALLDRAWEYQKEQQLDQQSGGLIQQHDTASGSHERATSSSSASSASPNHSSAPMSLEQVIQLAMDHVNKLAATIHDAVDNDTFHATITALVDAILSRLIHGILAMRDIGADESRDMASAFNSVAQFANIAFWKDDTSTPSEMQLRAYLPHWQMFWTVKDILDMTMKDILAALYRGDLHMFTHDQLVHLVIALFADTPRRDESIKAIRSADLNGTPIPPPPSEPLAPLTSSKPLSTLESHHHDRWDVRPTADSAWNDDNWSNDDDMEPVPAITAVSKERAMPAERSRHASDDLDTFAGNTSRFALQPGQDASQEHGAWSDDDDDAYEPLFGTSVAPVPTEPIAAAKQEDHAPEPAPLARDTSLTSDTYSASHFALQPEEAQEMLDDHGAWSDDFGMDDETYEPLFDNMAGVPPEPPQPIHVSREVQSRFALQSEEVQDALEDHGAWSDDMDLGMDVPAPMTATFDAAVSTMPIARDVQPSPPRMDAQSPNIASRLALQPEIDEQEDHGAWSDDMDIPVVPPAAMNAADDKVTDTPASRFALQLEDDVQEDHGAWSDDMDVPIALEMTTALDLDQDAQDKVVPIPPIESQQPEKDAHDDQNAWSNEMDAEIDVSSVPPASNFAAELVNDANVHSPAASRLLLQPEEDHGRWSEDADAETDISNEPPATDSVVEPVKDTHDDAITPRLALQPENDVHEDHGAWSDELDVEIDMSSAQPATDTVAEPADDARDDALTPRLELQPENDFQEDHGAWSDEMDVEIDIPSLPPASSAPNEPAHDVHEPVSTPRLELQPESEFQEDHGAWSDDIDVEIDIPSIPPAADTAAEPASDEHDNALTPRLELRPENEVQEDHGAWSDEMDVEIGIGMPSMPPASTVAAAELDNAAHDPVPAPHLECQPENDVHDEQSAWSDDNNVEIDVPSVPRAIDLVEPVHDMPSESNVQENEGHGAWSDDIGAEIDLSSALPATDSVVEPVNDTQDEHGACADNIDAEIDVSAAPSAVHAADTAFHLEMAPQDDAQDHHGALSVEWDVNVPLGDVQDLAIDSGDATATDDHILLGVTEPMTFVDTALSGGAAGHEPVTMTTTEITEPVVSMAQTTLQPKEEEAVAQEEGAWDDDIGTEVPLAHHQADFTSNAASDTPLETAPPIDIQNDLFSPIADQAAQASLDSGALHDEKQDGNQHHGAQDVVHAMTSGSAADLGVLDDADVADKDGAAMEPSIGADEEQAGAWADNDDDVLQDLPHDTVAAASGAASNSASPTDAVDDAPKALFETVDEQDTSAWDDQDDLGDLAQHAETSPPAPSMDAPSEPVEPVEPTEPVDQQATAAFATDDKNMHQNAFYDETTVPSMMKTVVGDAEASTSWAVADDEALQQATRDATSLEKEPAMQDLATAALSFATDIDALLADHVLETPMAFLDSDNQDASAWADDDDVLQDLAQLDAASPAMATETPSLAANINALPDDDDEEDGDQDATLDPLADTTSRWPADAISPPPNTSEIAFVQQSLETHENTTTTTPPVQDQDMLAPPCDHDLADVSGGRDDDDATPRPFAPSATESLPDPLAPVVSVPEEPVVAQHSSFDARSPEISSDDPVAAQDSAEPAIAAIDTVLSPATIDQGLLEEAMAHDDTLRTPKHESTHESAQEWPVFTEKQDDDYSADGFAADDDVLASFMHEGDTLVLEHGPMATMAAADDVLEPVATIAEPATSMDASVPMDTPAQTDEPMADASQIVADTMASMAPEEDDATGVRDGWSDVDDDVTMDVLQPLQQDLASAQHQEVQQQHRQLQPLVQPPHVLHVEQEGWSDDEDVLDFTNSLVTSPDGNTSLDSGIHASQVDLSPMTGISSSASGHGSHPPVEHHRWEYQDEPVVMDAWEQDGWAEDEEDVLQTWTTTTTTAPVSQATQPTLQPSVSANPQLQQLQPKNATDLLNLDLDDEDGWGDDDEIDMSAYQ